MKLTRRMTTALIALYDAYPAAIDTGELGKLTVRGLRKRGLVETAVVSFAEATREIALITSEGVVVLRSQPVGRSS